MNFAPHSGTQELQQTKKSPYLIYINWIIITIKTMFASGVVRHDLDYQNK